MNLTFILLVTIVVCLMKRDIVAMVNQNLKSDNIVTKKI